jgi:Tfp pilus assembly ATPase PilU
MLDPLAIKDIADLVKQGETVEGMLSFDQHLLQLAQMGRITEEDALRNASSQTDMRLMLDGFTQ